MGSHRRPSRKNRPSLGQAEWRILRYVAEHHPITVGQVARHAGKTTGQARTTVLTVMQRLCKKGYLTRSKKGGVYRYSPTVSKADLLRTRIREFISGALGGSVSPLVAYLSQSAELSDQDVEQLRAMLKHAPSKDKERR